MVKSLTDAEVANIMAECRANGELSEYREGSERFIQTPSPLGQGYGRSLQLRPGLNLNILNCEKRQAHRYKIRQHPQPMPLTFSYYLSGGCRGGGIRYDNFDFSVDDSPLAFQLPREREGGIDSTFVIPDSHHSILFSLVKKFSSQIRPSTGLRVINKNFTEPRRFQNGLFDALNTCPDKRDGSSFTSGVN